MAKGQVWKDKEKNHLITSGLIYYISTYLLKSTSFFLKSCYITLYVSSGYNIPWRRFCFYLFTRDFTKFLENSWNHTVIKIQPTATSKKNLLQCELQWSCSFVQFMSWDKAKKFLLTTWSSLEQFFNTILV